MDHHTSMLKQAALQCCCLSSQAWDWRVPRGKTATVHGSVTDPTGAVVSGPPFASKMSIAAPC